MVNAGNNMTVCADTGTIQLNGLVSNATGGIWTTTGNGSFSPNTTTLNATYTLTNADTAAGSIKFILTSTGNGTCQAYKDSFNISITPAPTVSAGTDINVCGDATSIALNGTITTAIGGLWSTTGSGTFSPSNTTIDPSYEPSSADTANGSVILTLTTTGNGTCHAYNDPMTLSFGATPKVSAGADVTICADVVGVTLNGSVSIASGGIWSTSGTGSFSPNTSSLTATYVPSVGDTTNGSVTLTLTTTGNQGCQPYDDQMTITFDPAPVVNAGSDITVCGDTSGIQLNGLISNAGGGLWTTTGTGTFSPNASTLNAVYDPSNADTTNGAFYLRLRSTGNGTCKTYRDSLLVTITNVPTVNAGNNVTVCGDLASISLDGSITTASGGLWTSSGTGTFNPGATNIDPKYIPSTIDTASGSVTLTLTTTGNGACKTYKDNVIITFNSAPTVMAGSDITICADASAVALNGSVNRASGGVWTTSGTGSFSPSAAALNANYVPSLSDTTTGTVILTLTTTGNQGCNAYNDQMSIIFDPAPIVEAGNDINICADKGTLQLNGLIINAGGGLWSTSGSGTFTPTASTLNSVYNLSNADTLAGSIMLKLTTTGNGTCQAYKDSFLVTINPAPTVSAGQNITVCGDVTSVPLDGTVIVANGGIWTTSGTGTFSPANTNIDPSYFPSSADTAAGSVTLTLTTTGNGLCKAYNDQMILNFNPVPKVNAGADITVCADVSGVVLSGIVAVATGGRWTSSGTGTFSPNNTTKNATYIPSNADTTNGFVTLTLTSTGNQGCKAYNDQVSVTLSNAPYVDAGPDVPVCSTNPDATLDGTIYTASGGVWTSGGTGTFSPSVNDLNATYQASNADTAAGSVTLYLTSTGNGSCKAVTDSMVVEINRPLITVFAGNDSLICGDDTVDISGIITIASGGIWSTMGDGTFDNNTDLNTYYHFGVIDTMIDTVSLVLTTTGNKGCAAERDTITLFIQDPLWLQVTSLDTACKNGGPFDIFSSTSTGQGFWQTSGDGSFSPGSTNLTPNYLPGAGDTANGNVMLTFTTTNNGVCTALNDSLYVELIDAPAVDFSSNDVCLNDTMNFTDLTTTIGNIVSWNWTFGDGSSSTLQNPTHAYNPDGTYTIELKVVTDYGCTDSISKAHKTNPLPVANFRGNALCFVDSVNFSDLSNIIGGTIVNRHWDFGDGEIDTTNNRFPSHAYDSAGTYVGTLIVTSDLGCTDTISDTLIVQPLPIADFSADTACYTHFSNFIDQSTIQFGSIIGWSWNFDGLGSNTTQNTSFTFPGDGFRDVTLIVTSAFNCRDTITKSVYVHPLPLVDFDANSFCLDAGVVYTDNSTIPVGNLVDWAWDFGDGSGGMNPTVGHFYNASGDYDVTLTMTSEYGCIDSLTKTITVDPMPVANFGMSKTVAQLLEDIDFTDLSSGNPVYWDWNFSESSYTGEPSTSTEQNPTYAYSSGGTQTVRLIITNAFGCTDTVYKDITIKQPPIVPTAFTPNNDGRNDVLNVMGGPFIEFSMVIYNNWGEQIFASNSQSNPWNGTHIGQPQPMGVYVYILKVVTEDLKEYQLHGDVTLIR